MPSTKPPLIAPQFVSVAALLANLTIIVTGEAIGYRLASGRLRFWGLGRHGSYRRPKDDLGIA